MYGILRVKKCQGNQENYSRFKSYYCGLCDSLSRDFGNLTRATVNYDMTFLYLLLDSLVDESRLEKGGCPTTPWKKRDITVHDRLHPFFSAANIYLAGLKVKDDLLDKGGTVYNLGFKAIKGKMEKAHQQLTQLGVDMSKVDNLFARQQDQERDGTTLEDYYQVTAQGLAYLLKEGTKLLELDKATQEIIEELGYQLGKVIYIMDSFVDYPSDTKNEQFNALAQAFGDKIQLANNIPDEIREEINSQLQSSLEEINQLLDKLELKKNGELIGFVINSLKLKIHQLIKNTEDMEEVERVIKSASPIYLLKHPSYFFKSRAASRRHRRHHKTDCCDCDCCECDDLLTTAICCDAADCDCDALECLSEGDPCELLECFC